MGKDVHVAVGHGTRPNGVFDPGALGDDGRYEHYEATEVAAECIEALTRCGVTFDHEVTGSGGPEDPNYAGTIENVNKGGYKLAVEIHFDWSKAPEGGFGHWYSDSGKAIADSVLAAWKQRKLPVRPSWHKYRDDLSFLKRTNPPAMLWECGRIQDFPRATNELMGEAIAEGIVHWLGRTWIPVNAGKKHYKVAVIGLGDVDGILAYLLGRQHAFKVLNPEDLPNVTVGHLIKVGGGAVRDYADMPGIDVKGVNRYETGSKVLAKILDPNPDRVTPWT